MSPYFFIHYYFFHKAKFGGLANVLFLHKTTRWNWDGSRSDLSDFGTHKKSGCFQQDVPFVRRLLYNILELLGVDGQRSDHEDVQIKCPYCATQFHHCLRYTRGDPRNIALIGHWDGWQPFSTSTKRSCGKVVEAF